MRLKLASLAFEISFISNWFGAQIKFTWGSIKVYVKFTSDSNEAQFDFFYVLLLKRKQIRIYTSYKSKKNSIVECSVSVVSGVTLHFDKLMYDRLL